MTGLKYSGLRGSGAREDVAVGLYLYYSHGMKSLNRGKSPHMILRVPEDLRVKVEARRKALGMTRSAFLRDAARVAVGDLCCIYDQPQGCPHVWCRDCRAWTVMETPEMAFCGHWTPSLIKSPEDAA